MDFNFIFFVKLVSCYSKRKTMRGLVISGGGSKGAFAGGVAQYLIEELKYEYDIFVGSSTGSLLISHLALGQVQKIKTVFTTVGQDSIFSHSPFIIKDSKHNGKQIQINHFNVLRQFIAGKKTFGESFNLRNLIFQTLSEDDFNELKASQKDVVVTVSNISLNKVEYKSVCDFDYDEFCNWIWVSCNFIPFMSLVTIDHCEYADGGFATRVPIEEAINRGATTVDVIVLDTEMPDINHTPSRNVFSLMTRMDFYMAERIARQNIRIGKLIARSKGAKLNFYYTPIDLATNSLIFDEKKMRKWWSLGYDYAKARNRDANEIRPD